MSAKAAKPDTPDNRLLRSAEKGDMQGLKEALAKGADVHAKDDGQNTSLHLASYRGHVDIVSFLIQSGADSNARNENKDLAVHLAALSNRIGVLKVLTDPTCTSKSDLEAHDAQGYCPIHYACGEGHMEVAEYLVKQLCVKTDSRNMDGLSPLMCAVQQGHLEVTKMLLGFEPSIIDQVNNSKDTSLHYAMISDAGIPMIEILLRSGADPIRKNSEGHTPLVEAVIEKKLECANYLRGVLAKYHVYPGSDGFTLHSQRAVAINQILDKTWTPAGSLLPSVEDAVDVKPMVRQKLKFSSGIRTKTTVEVVREEFKAAGEAPKAKAKSRIFAPSSSTFNF